MQKTLDLSKSIQELCHQDSEIIEIMRALGFESITEVGMLNTVGRFMTIPKGAAMKKVDMDQIRTAFENKGYTII